MGSRQLCKPLAMLDISIIGSPGPEEPVITSKSREFNIPALGAERRISTRTASATFPPAMRAPPLLYPTGSQGLDAARVSRWSKTERKASAIHRKPPRFHNQPFAAPAGRGARRQANTAPFPDTPRPDPTGRYPAHGRQDYCADRADASGSGLAEHAECVHQSGATASPV